MIEDPIVAEVREARKQHAEKFNFDLAAIFQDLQRQEVVSGCQLVTFPARKRNVQSKTAKKPMARKRKEVALA